MLQVLAAQPNFLLLDEPTNDLDLDTIGVLEDFLKDEYSGVLIVVSHDRYFLDKVVDHLFVLPGDGKGEIRDWQASFTDYLLFTEQEQRAQTPVQTSSPSRQQPYPERADTSKSTPKDNCAEDKSAKPLSKYERQQLERLEEEMETISTRQNGCQAMVDSFDPNRNGYTELTEWTEEVAALGEQLADVELKWLELADRADL